MNKIIRKYSLFHDLEYVGLIEDLLNHPKVMKMDRFIQHGDTTTLAHSLQVSYMAYSYCKKRGKSPVSAARAGLLHDFFLYDWHGGVSGKKRFIHGFLHGSIAKNNAKKYFLLNREEEDAIQSHMWPLTVIPPKSSLGWLIQYCDKYCTVKEVIKGFLKKEPFRLSIVQWENFE